MLVIVEQLSRNRKKYNKKLVTNNESLSIQNKENNKLTFKNSTQDKVTVVTITGKLNGKKERLLKRPTKSNLTLLDNGTIFNRSSFLLQYSPYENNNNTKLQNKTIKRESITKRI